MRYLFIFFLFPLFLNAQSNPSKDLDVDWLTDYQSAQKLAKNNNKNILMYFTGSDWCAPCKALKKDLFSTTQFAKLAQAYILLYIDLPRNKALLSPNDFKQNKLLLSQWNKKGIFPYINIINTDEKVVATMSGYGAKSDVIKYIEFLKRNKSK